MKRNAGIIKKYWMLYCCLSFFAVISIVFGIYPMISSIGYSFFKTNTILTNPTFVGFKNYSKLFKDSYFWGSLKITILFTVISVPLNLVAALVLAQLLDYKGLNPTMKLLFKLAVFVPFITPDVVSSIVCEVVN